MLHIDLSHHGIPQEFPPWKSDLICDLVSTDMNHVRSRFTDTSRVTNCSPMILWVDSHSFWSLSHRTNVYDFVFTIWYHSFSLVFQPESFIYWHDPCQYWHNSCQWFLSNISRNSAVSPSERLNNLATVLHISDHISLLLSFV